MNGDMAVQSFAILGTDDVVNDVMNTDLYKFGHNPMIHMDNKSKFNDDIFVRLLVIMKNVLISLAKEHRGPICRPPCDVIDDVITMENTFSGIIWDDLFRSGVKLKLYLYI